LRERHERQQRQSREMVVDADPRGKLHQQIAREDADEDKGDKLKIRETFMVPKDAIATIQAAVGVGSERPYYLRFQRPES
jgi:hypothetical protein